MLYESSYLCLILYKTAAHNNAEHMQGRVRITLQSQVRPKNRKIL